MNNICFIINEIKKILFSILLKLICKVMDKSNNNIYINTIIVNNLRTENFKYEINTSVFLCSY